jgi:hypothetical protein
MYIVIVIISLFVNIGGAAGSDAGDRAARYRGAVYVHEM